jgi:hypothetical protein
VDRPRPDSWFRSPRLGSVGTEREVLVVRLLLDDEVLSTLSVAEFSDGLSPICVWALGSALFFEAWASFAVLPVTFGWEVLIVRLLSDDEILSTVRAAKYPLEIFAACILVACSALILEPLDLPAMGEGEESRCGNGRVSPALGCSLSELSSAKVWCGASGSPREVGLRLCTLPKDNRPEGRFD